MSKFLDRNRIKPLLDNCNFRTLFIEELGWDNFNQEIQITVDETDYIITAFAHKRKVVAYKYFARNDDGFPEYRIRQKLEKEISKQAHEHITIYISKDKAKQYWHWMKRQPNSPDRLRTHEYRQDQKGEGLLQKLQHIVFTLEEEEDLTLIDVAGAIRSAFDSERVTRRFYDLFKQEHGIFLKSIEGIDVQEDLQWYTSLMLNRMMFIYFIQKRGFLDDDVNYLQNRLQSVRRTQQPNTFQSYYRHCLLRLFHEGLNVPNDARSPNLTNLIGNVPYLNGGLFEIHKIEEEYKNIEIPDVAFEKIFKFFDQFQWHLDDRPLRNDNEINPDVLGYIFEKYINQKDLGAYYSKEDITGYISRSTIIPYVLAKVIDSCASPELNNYIWNLLKENPDRYIYPSIKHGLSFDIYTNEELQDIRKIPDHLNRGINDLSMRADWCEVAPKEYGLPNENWRECFERRKHYANLSKKLQEGKIQSIDNLVTNNLDLERFTLDIIVWCDSPHLVITFWKALRQLSVLDPTCGSGAFLFAALKILEPLYFACIESLRSFLADHEFSAKALSTSEFAEIRASLSIFDNNTDENYAVLKSIIVNNLYGVDIVDEAVEICKLRLFLKLVAQLENTKNIEPLPDIDFNIRSGNSIVGFDSFSQLQNVLSDNLLKDELLKNVNLQASLAAKSFEDFQALQTKESVDIDCLTSSKIGLISQLNLLRTELDKFLAEEYGISEVDSKKFVEWQAKYKPFHWFVEYWKIISGGGFSIVVGNPPYLEAKKVGYEVKFLETVSTRAVHAMCIERSLALCSNLGAFGMILPLAIVSTQRMERVQQLLEKHGDFWFSNFAHRPNKLFDKVDLSLTIAISLRARDLGNTFSTGYLKWDSEFRDILMKSFRYTNNIRPRSSFWVPKFGQKIERSIFSRLLSIDTTIEQFVESTRVSQVSKSNAKVFYRSAGGRYWKVFTNFRPLYRKDGVPQQSSVETSLILKNHEYVDSALAVFSSSTYWWWYTISSDLWHVTRANDIGKFPIPKSVLSDQTLQEWGRELNEDLRVNSEITTTNRSTGKIETQMFRVKFSKEIIDCIDLQLQSHYGFSDEEIDFLINYDLKFRIGDAE